MLSSQRLLQHLGMFQGRGQEQRLLLHMHWTRRRKTLDLLMWLSTNLGHSHAYGSCWWHWMSHKIGKVPVSGYDFTSTFGTLVNPKFLQFLSWFSTEWQLGLAQPGNPGSLSK